MRQLIRRIMAKLHRRGLRYEKQTRTIVYAPWRKRSGKQYMPSMTKKHPRWNEFLERLEGPEGCDFKLVGPPGRGDTTWTCDGGRDKSKAQAILADMGFTWEEIEESCEYFDNHGGHCDCEILFNVNARKVKSES